jgi:hypothetical protein
MDGRAGRGSREGCMHYVSQIRAAILWRERRRTWRAQPAHPCAGVRREDSPLDCLLFPAHPLSLSALAIFEISACKCACFLLS